MDNDESDQLDDIHEEVKGSHAQLGAIDERTRNIEQSLESINDEVQNNREEIDELQGRVKRNTTIINAVTVGLSGLLLWVADKVNRFSPF